MHSMSASADPRQRPLLLVLAVAVLVLLLQLWLFHPIVVNYFPTLDELGVRAGSTRAGGPINPSSWFTQGFSGYFVPYPEWPAGGDDYWRPLVNVYYWLSDQAFGSHASAQLVMGYAAHAIVVGLVAYLALSVFGLTPWLALAALTIAAVNPAYVHQDLLRDPLLIPRLIQYPNYQMEIFAALLVLLALLAFLKRRFLLFSVLVTAALLLKETAVSAPLCAVAMISLWRADDRRRTLRNLSLLAAPLFAWLIGIGAMLVRHANSVYASFLHDPLPGLMQLPRRLLLWPTGLFQSPLADVRQALAGHNAKLLALYLIEICTNLAWWAALAWVLVVVVRRTRYTTGSRVIEPWIVVLIFALGNLLLAVLVMPAELRFGYLWFALAPAALFHGLARSKAGFVAAFVLTIGVVVPQVQSLASALSEDSIGAYRLARNGARQLQGLLGALPAETRVVYLLDDMAVQSASPQSFAALSGFRGRLILVNNALPRPGCRAPATGPLQQYVLTRSGVQTTLDYQAAACLERAWNVAPLALIDSNNVIGRGPWMDYHFPDLYANGRNSSAVYELGRRFTVRSRDPSCLVHGACVWLGFDPAAQRYYVVPLSGSTQ